MAGEETSKVFCLISSSDNGKLSEDIHNKLNLEFPEINFNLFAFSKVNSTLAFGSSFLNMS